MLVYVCAVATSGGNIEHFSHDLLLCSLFMLHLKGLSVIINSRPKQNECVSRDGGMVERRGAVGLSIGWVAATVRGMFGPPSLLLYGIVGESCAYMCVGEGRVEKGFRFPRYDFGRQILTQLKQWSTPSPPTHSSF